MPSKFEIYKQISRGKKPGHAQIITIFQGCSITRHIINGVGRHPDDTIPALHKRLTDSIAEKESLARDKRDAMATLEKNKPKGWLDLAAKMQRELELLATALPILRSALATVQKEDPLMVHYF